MPMTDSRVGDAEPQFVRRPEEQVGKFPAQFILVGDGSRGRGGQPAAVEYPSDSFVEEVGQGGCPGGGVEGRLLTGSGARLDGIGTGFPAEEHASARSLMTHWDRSSVSSARFVTFWAAIWYSCFRVREYSPNQRNRVSVTVSLAISVRPRGPTTTTVHRLAPYSLGHLYRIILRDYMFRLIPLVRIIGAVPSTWEMLSVRNGRQGCGEIDSLRPLRGYNYCRRYQSTLSDMCVKS